MNVTILVDFEVEQGEDLTSLTEDVFDSLFQSGFPVTDAKPWARPTQQMSGDTSLLGDPLV
jgi:hypothetical protein